MTGAALPRISIITPSFNQGTYLEATMRSVLDQGYPNLEYIVVDGGSTDETAAVIERFAGQLAHWESEPDRGQAHAINKGFARATGEVLAWLNSDDLYCPWTLQVVGEIFAALPHVHWLTSSRQVLWRADGLPATTIANDGFSRVPFWYGRTLPGARQSRFWIQQESTFWRKSLWEAAGGRVDESLYYALDLELWSRFWKLADLVAVDLPLGGFRVHGAQKTTGVGGLEYQQQALRLLARGAPRVPSAVELFVRRKLMALAGRLGPAVGYPARFAVYDHQKQDWGIETRFIA